MKKLLLIFLFPIILQAQLNGLLGLLNDNTNYGIDTSGASRVFFVDALYGNDAKDGLSGKTAWKTLNKVNTYGQQSGDSILFRRGQTFTNKTILNDSMSYALTIADGIPNMYFGAYGSGDKPIIDGGGLGGARYVFFYWNKTPLTTGTTTFRGINFFSPDSSSESYQGQYGGSGEFYSYETMCFEAYGLGTTVIDSCTFDGNGKSYSCMYVSNTISDSLPYKITNSIFKNAYAEHGIYITTSNGNRFEHNLFQNIPEAGISTKYHKNDTIRYNYFDRVGWTTSVADVDSLLFAYNVARCDSISGGSDNGTTFYPDKILNTIQYGLYFWNECKGVKVLNNTWVVDYYTKDIEIIRIRASSTGSYEIKNNVIAIKENKDPSGSSKYFITYDDAITLDSDYNEFYVPDSNAFSTWHRLMFYESSSTNFYYNLTEWQNGEGQDVHSVLRDGADTLFTNITNADYTLFAGSPAINKGTDVGETVDYLGNPIIGLPDIGAYESNTPDEADSLVWESDFSVDATGFGGWRITNTGNQDGVLDSNDCLIVYANTEYNTHFSTHNTNGQILNGLQYTISFDYYIPEGQDSVNAILTDALSGMTSTTETTVGSWARHSQTFTSTGSGNQYWSFRMRHTTFGAIFAGADNPDSDRIYLKNVRIYKVKGLPD